MNRSDATAGRDVSRRPMIKLVVSDMDGTLIDADEVLSDKAIALSRRLKESGIMFSLATGRVEYLADDYARRLGLSVPYVACNGATLVDGRRVIERKQIPVQPLAEIIEEADLMGMSIVYSREGCESVWRETPWILSQRTRFDRYHTVHRFSPEEWASLTVDKVSIMDDERDGRIACIEAMCRRLPSSYGFTRYVDRSVEIVDGSADKANGIASLARYLGLDMNEVMAIGDHQNDIEMLLRAGVGVAVANATADVKEIADYVCKNRCIDGVVEAVDHYWDRMVPCRTEGIEVQQL
ncbi:MAG: HAD family hydrolase [Sphaerochaetaceae bacterium]|nr:HAD family hydrolase [Sphaerochaetaceae bacterium]